MTNKKESVTAVPLPAQPNIPPSNASYPKVSQRLYQAAQTGNLAAIAYVKGTIRGTNTYCKMLRRYADQLTEAVKTNQAAAAQAPKPKAVKAVKVKVLKAVEGKAVKMPKAITADEWAESGGTVGIFGPGVRAGKIKLLPSATHAAA